MEILELGDTLIVLGENHQVEKLMIMACDDGSNQI